MKIKFVQRIIQDINTTRTSIVEFLDRSRRRCAREQIGPRVTSIDPVCIEELEEDEAEVTHPQAL